MQVRVVLYGFIFFTCAALALARPASAQNVGGSIQGIVADATGAALPGVTVVIRNTATGGYPGDRDG